MSDRNWEQKIRSWAWHRLVFLADRISPEDAFRRASGLAFHLKKGEGWVLNRERDGKGVPVWYRGPDYAEHSHDGYDEEPVIGPTTFTTVPGGITLSADTTEADVEKYLKSALWWRMNR